MRFRIATTTMIVLGIASPAFANEFLFSHASFLVVGPAFLLWLAAGFILQLYGWTDLRLAGASAFAIGGAILVITSGHFEIILMIWMIYLALLTVWYAPRRAGVAPRERWRNVSFHGAFLAMVIAGGAIAKGIYWGRVQGFAAWLGWMQEMYPKYLLAYLILALATGAWVGLRQRRRIAFSRGSPVKKGLED